VISPLDRYNLYRRALGGYGATLTRTDTLDDDLHRAARRGWSMRELARFALTDWPDRVQSPAAIIRTRTRNLADLDPPAATPTPPRATPRPRDGVPMPDDVRAWIHTQEWWRPRR
jgi:hypothetical protein